MWIRRSRVAPLGQQLYDGIRHAILRGRLLPGARLPSSRELATREGVARNTVLRVFEQLLEEGYLVGRHGAGTFVAPELPDDLLALVGSSTRSVPTPGRPPRMSRRGRQLAALTPSWAPERPPLPYDFRYGRPSLPDFPLRTWRRLLAECTRDTSGSDLDYGEAAGHPGLREAIAGYLARSRAVRCRPEQVVVVHGSQQALALTTDVLLDPGDRVLVEEPGYAGATAAFRAAGVQIVVGRVGTEGLDLGTVDRRRLRGVRLVYVTPSHQFPTGVIMPLAQRLSLLRWAERTGAWIFEDDYDSEFRFRAPPVESLQGLDQHGTVVYAGTFSKVLFPALRIGYLVLPEPLVHTFTKSKALHDTGTAGLEQRVLERFIRAGHFERHLRRSRARNAVRRAVLLDQLSHHFGENIEISGGNAGLHVMLRLPGLAPAVEPILIERAAAAGVGIYSPAAFYQEPTHRDAAALMLGYASLSPERIQRGVARLAQAIGGLLAANGTVTPRRSSRPARTSSGRSSITK